MSHYQVTSVQLMKISVVLKHMMGTQVDDVERSTTRIYIFLGAYELFDKMKTKTVTHGVLKYEIGKIYITTI